MQTADQGVRNRKAGSTLPGAGATRAFDPASLPEGRVRELLHEQLSSGQRPTPPWRKGIKLSTRLDLLFFLFMFICLYFALLVEYDLDMLDLIRTPAPGRSQSRMTRYARRMERRETKQARRNPVPPAGGAAPAQPTSILARQATEAHGRPVSNGDSESRPSAKEKNASPPQVQSSQNKDDT